MLGASPALGESLAQEVVARYAALEQAMIRRLAIYLETGIDAPDWLVQKQAQLAVYRKQAERALAALEAEAAEGVSTALHEAYERGGAAAIADLGAGAVVAPLATHALEALVRDTLMAVASTHPRILREVLDAYREVLAATIDPILLGTQTRRQAAQQALNRFAERGITGFIDRAGRGWNLESYVEMAMRTGAGNAAVQGHLDRLQANGLDLVIVSDAPRECPLCRPFEGRVLSIGGDDPEHLSVADAKAQGLHHPSCRHSLSAYQEGVTRPLVAKSDLEGYAAGQKQRYLERQIRAQKRVQVAAMDDAAKAAAQAKIRAYQAKLRAHIIDNDLKRLRYREQIGKAI